MSVLVQFKGSVTFEETVHATDVFYNDARSDNIRNVFWDFSGIEDFIVDENQVQ